jgi:hypothetical protein
MKQIGSHCSDCNVILFEYFSKICQKIKVSLKPENNKGYCILKPAYIFVLFFLEWEMFQIKFVEKTKTQALCSVISVPPPPRKSCPLWNNVEKYCRPGVGEGGTEACWIHKATNTYSQFGNTYCFPTATMVVRTRLHITLYADCLSCFSVRPLWKAALYVRWSTSIFCASCACLALQWYYW